MPALPGVIDRWELLQAQALSKELRTKQNLQKWQQFNSDLNNIWAWLGDTEEELDRLRHLALSTDIHTIECHIKKLKVPALAFPLTVTLTHGALGDPGRPGTSFFFLDSSIAPVIFVWRT